MLRLLSEEVRKQVLECWMKDYHCSYTAANWIDDDIEQKRNCQKNDIGGKLTAYSAIVRDSSPIPKQPTSWRLASVLANWRDYTF
jgi:hypothetical protein